MIFVDPLLFGAVHDEILADPLVPIPIDELEFVHVKVAPVGLLEKFWVGIISPGQKLRADMLFVIGLGLMVIVNIIDVPWQLLRVGITVIEPVIFEPVVLSGAVQVLMFPNPLDNKPIFVLEFVQVNVAPFGVLTKFPIFIISPGQTVILLFWVIIGKGFTVIFLVIIESPHSLVTFNEIVLVPIVVNEVFPGFWAVELVGFPFWKVQFQEDIVPKQFDAVELALILLPKHTVNGVIVIIGSGFFLTVIVCWE